VLASGIVIVQVVANPLISLLGPARTVHSRLTFAQAFNSLGTTLFPHFGSILILGSLAAVDPKTLSGEALAAYRSQEAEVVVNTYLALAAALAVVALAVWLQRHRLREAPADETDLAGALHLLRRPRFAMGTLGIFLYVGAEVTIGSLMVLFLIQPDVLAVSQLDAGKLVAWYWGGAMAGRFVGAGLLKLLSPGKVLAAAAALAVLLLAVSAGTEGPVSGYALIAIGLCNSIMFPTIFALACDGLGRKAADGSGIICMAIVGGAILPPLSGWIADLATLRLALAVPAVAYLLIVLFGLFATRPVAPLDEEVLERAPAMA
jgi:FHS family L-fucose permease-like MFS transporter